MDNQERDPGSKEKLSGKIRPLFNITSEIGPLKTVLLHRPGQELEKLTPDLLQEFLFDDIPWLKKMQEEHDEFADLLRSQGAKVLYVEDLLLEVLADDEVKKAFILDLLNISQIENLRLREALIAYLNSRTLEEVVQIAIAGVGKPETGDLDEGTCLWNAIHKDYPLYIRPVPNLYFMRDPAAVIGSGICINSMNTKARRREPQLIKYIYSHYPGLDQELSPLWYDYTIPYNLEGGDVLVLGKEVIAIGCSERTSSIAIEMLAETLFKQNEQLKEVLAIRIPALRAFMHLDTVFTMIDHDKFSIYPGIQAKVEVYKLTRGKKGGIKVKHQHDLFAALKSSLKLPAIQLIQSGGGDAVAAAREQWNDSTNTLAVSPGVVITYSRNEISNETLRKNGIEVLEINGSELVRGRGGPRCMSCPLVREDI